MFVHDILYGLIQSYYFYIKIFISTYFFFILNIVQQIHILIYQNFINIGLSKLLIIELYISKYTDFIRYFSDKKDNWCIKFNIWFHRVYVVKNCSAQMSKVIYLFSLDYVSINNYDFTPRSYITLL